MFECVDCVLELVYDDDAVCDEFAGLLTRELGLRAEAPYNGAEYDLLTGRCLDAGNSTRIKKPAARKVSPVFQRLLNAGQRLLAVIGRNEGGANKYMRAPVREKAFDGSGKSTRLAGTQGFRHRGKTNVAFCDGHVESLRKPYTADGSPGNTAPGCGFLSPDNRLYSLDKD